MAQQAVLLCMASSLQCLLQLKESCASVGFNPLYTGRLFHCYMLDESICHFRGVRSILPFLFYFDRKILLATIIDPDQVPHYVASNRICNVWQ